MNAAAATAASSAIVTAAVLPQPQVVAQDLLPQVPPGLPPATPPITTEMNELVRILEWIGFADINNRRMIVDESFKFYEDLNDLNEKDIDILSSKFSARIVANGRVNVGLRKT